MFNNSVKIIYKKFGYVSGGSYIYVLIIKVMVELNKLIEQYNNDEITCDEYYAGLDRIGWMK